VQSVIEELDGLPCQNELG